MVSLAQPQSSRKVTESILISGGDRFAHIKDVGAYEGQTLIMELPITVAVFPRLQSLANNYQNWRVEKLGFRVNPQISTSTNGGYVCGYSRDPLEKIGEGADALNAITSLRGSQTKKWWEDSVVTSFGQPKNLFTQESGDERLYADGIFYLASDGKATSPGALTIYVDYTVRLIKPVLRGEDDDATERMEETKLLGNLYYVYVDGDSATGYLVSLDANGKIQNMELVLPGIDDWYHNTEPGDTNQLFFGTAHHIPGLKTDQVSEYNYTPTELLFVTNAIDGKSGFNVKMFGQATISVSAYVGDDYSNAQGNINMFHVPGPLEGQSLKDYGLYSNRATKEMGRKGQDLLCVMKTNKRVG